MRTINGWDDLRPFGIIALTGEACGFAMRVLCDVTEEGKNLIERFLGDTVKVTIGSNWNGSSYRDNERELHVGSVLLPWGILPELGAFALATTGTETVAIMKDRSVREVRDGYPEDHVQRYIRRSSQPGTGDRNQHAMSGRTV